MNFNVYIDAATGARLANLAKRRRASRNLLVREALNQLLDRESVTGWPATVLDFVGIKGTKPFEQHRRSLRPARNDPLA